MIIKITEYAYDPSLIAKINLLKCRAVYYNIIFIETQKLAFNVKHADQLVQTDCKLDCGMKSSVVETFVLYRTNKE